jgi:hypothetical protein
MDSDDTKFFGAIIALALIFTGSPILGFLVVLILVLG